MNVWVNVHTCWTYGGDPSVSLVGEFLRYDCSGFGAAISELDIHVYFDTRKSADEFRTPFDFYIKKLPLARFYRKKRSFSVSFLSQLGDSQLVEGHGPASFTLFASSAREICSALGSVEKKLKPDDDFDRAAFRGFLDAKAQALPQTETEFLTLERMLRESRKPNQSLEPTTLLGTSAAEQPLVPSRVVAHL